MKCLLLIASLVAVARAAPIEKRIVLIPMRDGVRLATNVFRPERSPKTPALLIRTPYNKGPELLPGYVPFIDRGYAIVVQDLRGRYASEGKFSPITQERNDGEDTLNWIARQPWSDGNIGMLGGSYVGIVQWQAALTGNRHLKAIFPLVSGWDEYLDRFYSRGGAFKLGHRLLWLAENFRVPGHRSSFESYTRHLPLRTMDRAATGNTVDFFQRALDHPSYNEFWKRRSLREAIDRIRVPVFSVTGWYDNYAESDLETFTAISSSSAAHRIVVGPWGHSMATEFPGIDFGSDSGTPVRRHQLRWFDYWLRNPQPALEFAQSPVRIFVMGSNRWRDEREWPLKRAQTIAFYLGNRVRANSAKGDGTLQMTAARNPGQDEYVYDPRTPVPTRGGAVCCNPKIFPYGPMDQREVEAREDVLVYSTPPLKQDVEVTGPVRAILYVSSSAPDTDFTAKLVDVFPDGHARNLCDGILRLRYRNGPERAELAKPGTVYPITVEAGVTSNVFRAGHRIRIEISSSNFPRFDRNPNTGKVISEETELRTARQTIHHGRDRASHLLLPVVP